MLLAFDFDGALAPIVPLPPDARPFPGSVEAIERLSRVDGVLTALVSGRSRDDLATVSGARPSDRLLLSAATAPSSTRAVRPAWTTRRSGVSPW